MFQPVLLSTCYLGPIDYYAVLAKYPQIYVEQFEHYSRQTYRNRTLILSANGPLALSIPVIKGKELKIYTKNLLIDNRSRWKAMHMRAIESAYRSSPFYIYFIDDIFNCYSQQIDSLLEFNCQMQKIVLEHLGISPNILYTSAFKNVPENTIDLADAFHPASKYNSGVENWEPYYQVFSTKFGFVPQLGILDLLFNLGPAAEAYLKNFKLGFNLHSY